MSSQHRSQSQACLASLGASVGFTMLLCLWCRLASPSAGARADRGARKWSGPLNGTSSSWLFGGIAPVSRAGAQLSEPLQNPRVAAGARSRLPAWHSLPGMWPCLAPHWHLVAWNPCGCDSFDPCSKCQTVVHLCIFGRQLGTLHAVLVAGGRGLACWDLVACGRGNASGFSLQLVPVKHLEAAARVSFRWNVACGPLASSPLLHEPLGRKCFVPRIAL